MNSATNHIAPPKYVRTLRAVLYSVAFSSLFAIPLFAEDIKLEAAVNRSEIYTGESFLLQIKLSGADSPTEPDLSAIKDCTIRFLGSQSDSRLSIVIVNGRMQREQHTGRLFSYELTPLKEGLIATSPVSLKADGKMLSAAGPVVKVHGIEKQDTVLVNVSASRNTTLVDETFTIKLTIAIKALPAPYTQEHPLNAGEPPTLIIPFLGQVDYPGLEGSDIKALLQKMVAEQQNGPGVLINDFTLNQGPFGFGGMFNMGGFLEQQKAKFMLPHAVVTINGQQYIQYEIALEYTPKEENSHTFGPVIFKGAPITAVDASGNIRTKPVFAVGAAVVVRVVPPPEENRPKTYIGVIGSNLTANAELDTQTCNAGDPLKLSLTFTGNVNLANAHPLFLNEQEGVSLNFKVYDDSIDTVKKDDKTRQYTYTIRPVTPGTYEFPPISASYYDTVSRSYQTIKTRPIPISVKKGIEIDENIIINTSTNTASTNVKISSGDNALIAPLTMTPSGADPESLALDYKHALIAAAGVFTFIAALFWRLVSQLYQHRMTTRKRRHAFHTAEELLQKAAHEAKSGDIKNAHLLITQAFKRYFGWRFGMNTSGVTPSDVKMVLQDIQTPETIATPMLNIMERHFNAVYSATETVKDVFDIADVELTRSLLLEIENLERKKKPA